MQSHFDHPIQMFNFYLARTVLISILFVAGLVIRAKTMFN
jgi:hypothetical protein